MKNSKYTKVAIIIMVILFVIVSMLGCTVHHNHSHPHSHHKSKKMPPGQAKKISGDKSAKSHAHGHR
ncbi:hypothetical protein [Flavobacterium flavigenum]|uniref:hypothetical protein n=1 Tax=Flavobacterium flavigenum TaxID=3003258 RepID=UPI002482F190|nr:hypothetical protein [Flavobacterium flavigenum]